MIHASYSKLSKELKYSIKIKVGLVVLELLIKIYFFFTVLSWPAKISMPFFEFLGQYIIFQKAVDNFEIEHNTC